MKYLGEEGLKTLIQKIKNNAGSGTGNVSSDTINSIMVVDELPETEVEGVLYLVKESVTEDDGNLYDASTAVVLDTYISSSDGEIGSYIESDKTTYLAIEPSTTYKITKTAGARFVVGTCANTPTYNTALNNIIKDNTATEITTTSGSSDNYLAIFYCTTTEDTLSEEELRKSIVVTKVETSTNLFKTSANLYSSSGSTYSSPSTRGGITYTYDTNSETINLNGTTNYGETQGFKQSETLEAGKTYNFYTTIDSGNVNLGSKSYALLLEIKETYNGSTLAECYVSPTDSSSNPTQATYTPSSNLTEWYVMISQRSSEVTFDNCNITIHVEEV